MDCDRYFRLWADIDLSAARENIQNIQANLKPGVKSCAVIKADAYGHGAVEVARAIDDIVDFYAVATIDEAMELRGNAFTKPILILGYVHPSMYELAVQNDIRLPVFDYETAEEISEAAARAGKMASVHIKIDTGMSRIGFRPSAASVECVLKINNLPGIEIEGIFTHFANSDDKTADKAMKQLDIFKAFIAELEANGLNIPVKHCANSAAATYLREADMDMVRLGISIYGLYPSQYIHQIELRPALSLKSHVVMVKTIPAGTSVGYGSTWTADKKSVIATIPVGYADGYFRSLSNKGYVLINGSKYPIVGRVCMDQIIVDVSDKPDVARGDEVVLIGQSGDLKITTEEIADLAGSFNYEFVCGLTRRVARKYYIDGRLSGIRDEFKHHFH